MFQIRWREVLHFSPLQTTYPHRVPSIEVRPKAVKGKIISVIFRRAGAAFVLVEKEGKKEGPEIILSGRVFRGFYFARTRMALRLECQGREIASTLIYDSQRILNLNRKLK